MSRTYPARPMVGLGVVLLRRQTVLLVRRAKPPGIGTWSLPGGAQELGETAEAGAQRELMEETGVTAGPLRLIAHVDSIHHDTAGRVQFHYTILDFAGAWMAGAATAGSDVSEVAWAQIEDLAPYALTNEAVRVISLAVSSAHATEPHCGG